MRLHIVVEISFQYLILIDHVQTSECISSVLPKCGSREGTHFQWKVTIVWVEKFYTAISYYYFYIVCLWRPIIIICFYVIEWIRFTFNSSWFAETYWMWRKSYLSEYHVCWNEPSRYFQFLLLGYYECWFSLGELKFSYKLSFCKFHLRNYLRTFIFKSCKHKLWVVPNCEWYHCLKKLQCTCKWCIIWACE